MAIELSKEAEQPLQAVKYEDLSLPVGMIAMLRLTPSGIEELRYDQDGDGVFESTI